MFSHCSSLSLVSIIVTITHVITCRTCPPICQTGCSFELFQCRQRINRYYKCLLNMLNVCSVLYLLERPDRGGSGRLWPVPPLSCWSVGRTHAAGQSQTSPKASTSALNRPSSSSSLNQPADGEQTFLLHTSTSLSGAANNSTGNTGGVLQAPTQASVRPERHVPGTKDSWPSAG